MHQLLGFSIRQIFFGFLILFYLAKAVGDVLDVLNRFFWRQCRYQRGFAPPHEQCDQYEYQYGQLMPVQITQMYAGRVSGSERRYADALLRQAPRFWRTGIITVQVSGGVSGQ